MSYYSRYQPRTRWQRIKRSIGNTIVVVFGIAFVLALIAIPVLYWGTIFYVLGHFISKFW